MPTKTYQSTAHLHPKEMVDHRVNPAVAWVPLSAVEIMVMEIAPQHTAWTFDQIEAATSYALGEVEANNEHPVAVIYREGVECLALQGEDLAEIVRSARVWFREARAA